MGLRLRPLEAVSWACFLCSLFCCVQRSTFPDAYLFLSRGSQSASIVSSRHVSIGSVPNHQMQFQTIKCIFASTMRQKCSNPSLLLRRLIAGWAVIVVCLMALVSTAHGRVIAGVMRGFLWVLEGLPKCTPKRSVAGQALAPLVRSLVPCAATVTRLYVPTFF